MQLSWILPKIVLFQDWESDWQKSANQSLKTFKEYSYRTFTGLLQRVDLAKKGRDTSNNPSQRWIAKEINKTC